MAFPTLSEAQISSLVNIGDDIWVEDCLAPDEEEVIRDAKKVCDIFGWHNIEKDASRLGIQKTNFLKDPNGFEATNIDWFSLGVVFQYANSYIASINLPSMKFLRYVVTCFNDGWRNQWGYRPDGKECGICRTGDGQPGCTECVKEGEDILKRELRAYELHQSILDNDELW